MPLTSYILSPMKSLLILLLFCVPTFAQDCKLTIKESPELRGLKLGMKLDDSLALLKGAEVPDPFLGRQDVTFLRSELARIDRERFKNISRLSITYLDGQIVDLTVEYNDVRFRDTAEFAGVVSSTLNLPDSWEGRSIETLQCVGFAVEIFAGMSMARIHIKDANAEATFRARMKERDEKKKDAFRP